MPVALNLKMPIGSRAVGPGQSGQHVSVVSCAGKQLFHMAVEPDLVYGLWINPPRNTRKRGQTHQQQTKAGDNGGSGLVIVEAFF